MTKIDRPDAKDRITVEDDEKKRALDLYDMRLVPPTPGIFDEPTRCYRINLEWAKYVMGMVSWLATSAPWQDAKHEGYSAIEAILQFMIGLECGDIMAFELRQNPTNPCLLEQSRDDGQSWITVFDYSLCQSIVDQSRSITVTNNVENNESNFETIYNNYTTNYIDSPDDVYPDLAPAGDTSALNAAYCNALWSLVNTACEAAITYYRELDQLQNEINVGIGIAVFFLTVIAIAGAIPTAGASLTALAPAAALWGAGIGVGAVLGNALVDYYQQHTVDQFQDTGAREDVVCYLYETIDVANASLAAVRAALPMAQGTPNAIAISQFLSILLQHDSTYAAFLEKWNNNKGYADAGIDMHCPCEPDDYRVWIWNFADGLGDFTVEEGTFDGAKVVGEFDGGSRKILTVTMPMEQAWRIAGAKMQLERIDGIQNGTYDVQVMRLRLNPGVNTPGDQFPINQAFGSNGVLNPCNPLPAGLGYFDNMQEVKIDCTVSQSATSAIYLHSVTIQFVSGFAKGGYKTSDNDICV